MKQSIRYTVTIQDKTFTLVSDESRERIEAVSTLVDSVMTELSTSLSGSHSLLATMTALTIANDLLAERDQMAAVSSCLEDLIQSVDAALEDSEEFSVF